MRARRGVLLAAGGFERNEVMRKQYQKAPIGTEWTVGAFANTGDAIEAAQRIGAGLDLMDDAWWGPSIPAPGGPYFALAERNLPGSIIVNGGGQRYVNECLPYVDAVHTMYDRDTPAAPTIPSWMVFDQRYRDRYIFAGRRPPPAALPPVVRGRDPVPRVEPGRVGGPHRRAAGGAGVHCRPLQHLRGDRRRRGFQPGRIRLRPVLRRSTQRPTRAWARSSSRPSTPSRCR